jgi:hypothetical protein
MGRIVPGVVHDGGEIARARVRVLSATRTVRSDQQCIAIATAVCMIAGAL